MLARANVRFASTKLRSLLKRVGGSAIASLNLRLQLIELEDAGHCLHDEYPEQFNSFLLDWLETAKFD